MVIMMRIIRLLEYVAYVYERKRPFLGQGYGLLLRSLRPIETSLFFTSGAPPRLHPLYHFKTALDTATKITQNNIIIISNLNKHNLIDIMA